MNDHRRKLLIASLKGSLGLAVSAIISPLLSSCKKTNDAPINSKQVETDACPGQKVEEEHKMLRESLAYVDSSPVSGRTCDNCKVYVNQINNESCGGCKVVPGPIHPKGWCKAWLQRM